MNWVIKKENGAFDIIGGSREEAESSKPVLIYGPFDDRREAKGCKADLSSADPNLMKLWDKKKTDYAPAEEAEAQATEEQPKKAKGKK